MGAPFMVRLSKVALMEALISMEFERTARASESDGNVLLSDGIVLVFGELVTTS